MRAWWATLDKRERLALVAAGVIGLAFVYWLAIWRPLGMAEGRSAERLAAAVQDLAWMQAASVEAQRLKAQPSLTGNRGDLSLLALAEQSARTAGLGSGFRRGEPIGDDRLRVTLEGIAFDSLMTWLGLLEARYGISTDEFSVDRAGAPGLVDARLTLVE